MFRFFFTAAFFLVVATFLFCFVAFADGTVATAPAAAPTSWDDLTTILLKSVTAALMAALAAAATWAQGKLPAWMSAQIDLRTTMEALDWEKYVDAAMQKAFSYAQTHGLPTPAKLDDLEKKNDFLGHVLAYLDAHYPDIVKYIDKDGDKIIDVVQTHMVSSGTPATLFQEPEEPPRPTRSRARASADAATSQIAGKFAPAGKA